MMAFNFPVCPVCRGHGRVAVKGDLAAVEGPVCSTCQGTGDLPRSLREVLRRAAEADLRAARRYGEVGIAQTHHGLLNLSYERDARVYELRRFDGSGLVLARGPKRVVLPALIHSYVLVVEG